MNLLLLLRADSDVQIHSFKYLVKRVGFTWAEQGRENNKREESFILYNQFLHVPDFDLKQKELIVAMHFHIDFN